MVSKVGLEPFVLAIETASETCSVGVFAGENLVAIQEIFLSQMHAKMLTTLIQSVMDVVSLPYSQLSAVAISAGPGSYTGLRIGTSTAKGICFAHSIPLIQIPTLTGIAWQVSPIANLFPECKIGILLDARRMEVYAHFFSKEIVPQTPKPQPVIINQAIIQHWNASSPTILAGSGVAKIQPLIKANANLLLLPPINCSARSWGKPIFQAWQQQDFVDLDTFEPEYLKPVMPTIEKPKLPS